MAKKLGKFLLATAAIGAAVAGAYYYMQKKEGIHINPIDDDDDDFDDDFDEDCEPSRNYVPLTPEAHAEETVSAETDNSADDFESDFTPLSEQLEYIAETVSETIEDVEEFFDEKDI